MVFLVAGAAIMKPALSVDLGKSEKTNEKWDQFMVCFRKTLLRTDLQMAVCACPHLYVRKECSEFWATHSEGNFWKNLLAAGGLATFIFTYLALTVIAPCFMIAEYSPLAPQPGFNLRRAHSCHCSRPLSLSPSCRPEVGSNRCSGDARRAFLPAAEASTAWLAPQVHGRVLGAHGCR